MQAASGVGSLRAALATGLTAALIVAACAAGPEITSSPTIAPVDTFAAPSAAPSAGSTPGPKPTATRPFSATIAIDGDPEVVFDWSKSPCGSAVIPDLPARAFRDADGLTHLLLSHTTSYRMSGASLDSVVVDCDPIGRSDHKANPALFNDNEWIASPYTEDGQTVYALVHNEYQGHAHSGRCPTGDYFDCWDNSITLAVSTDGGASFEHARTPPNHLVATPPVVYDGGNGPSGYREPSNIIKGRDGFYYAYFNVSEPVTLKQWVCVMRTPDLGDPSAWRYREAGEWSGRFTDPYLATPGAGAHGCPPLDQNDIGHALNDSVTWNSALDRYVLIGLSADHIGGREVWGVYYAFSTDLLDWSRRQLLMEIPLPWTVANPGSDLSYLYPTLIDPDSESRNFETADGEAYLYLVRNNRGHASLDRDLIRYRVTLTMGT